MGYAIINIIRVNDSTIFGFLKYILFLYRSFIMNEIAERLKSERKRLGFTQKQIAQAIGIGEASWNRYEKYAAPFDTNVMIGLHEQGFDILYLLFGVRQIHSPMMVSDEFLQVFTLYNQLDSKGKKLFIEMADIFVRTYNNE